jgi:hypothetical protein
MKQRDYLSEFCFDLSIQGATNGLLINHSETATNTMKQMSTVCTTKEEALALIKKQLDFWYN